MRMNLAALSISVRKQYIRLDISTKQMRRDMRSPRQWIFTMQEAAHILDALRGEAAFYPFFDDGIHLVKFTPRGAREVSTSHEPWINTLGLYFTFPGEWLAEKLADLLSLQGKWGYDVNITVSHDELRDVAQACAPITSWQYADSVEEALYNTRNRDDVDASSLDRALENIHTHAENLSDGEEVIIHLSDDTAYREVPNWLWWFERGGEQVGLHGGLIAGQSKSGRWTYRTYT